jgi:DNA repair protein RecO (recombination protein O)
MLVSPFGLAGDYSMSVALDFVAEVSEHLLPPHEVNEKFFRLLGAVITQLRTHPKDGPWLGVNYFIFWAVKLSGFLPELKVCEDSLNLAREMARKPIAEIDQNDFSRKLGFDLRRQLVRAIESQVERRLITVPVLEALSE